MNLPDRPPRKRRQQLQSFPLSRRTAGFGGIVLIAFFLLFLTFTFSAIHAELPPVPAASDSRMPAKRLSTIIVENYYPYTFVNEKGQPDGYSVDLARAVARVMGFDLDIRPGPWDEAKQALADGRIDFLPMMAYSSERDRTFDFSEAHTIAHDTFFVKKGAPRFSTAVDLKGRAVAVMKNDAAHDYLLSSGIATPEKLMLVGSLPEALRKVSLGEADAALMPKLVGLLHVKNLGLANIEIVPAVVTEYNRPFSFAVREGNRELLEHLSEGLAIVKASGEYGDIHRKWFAVVEPPERTLKDVFVYLLWGGGLLLAFAVAGVGWSMLLKRQVALRTRELVEEIGERKRAEAALRESQATFRDLFEKSADAILLIDQSRVFVECNQAALNLLKMSREEFLNRPPVRISPEFQPNGRRSDEAAQDMMDQAYAKGLHRFDWTCVNAEGGEFIVEVSLMPISIGGQAMLHTSWRDITERKRAEESLRLHSAMLSNMEEGVALMRLDDATIVYVNPKFAEIFGYSEEEMLGRHASILNAPTAVSPEEVAADILGSLDRDGLWKGEVYNRKKDGTAFWTFATVSLFEHPLHGRVLVTAQYDVSERKNAQEALQRSERKYRTLLENIPHKIFYKDRDSVYVACNDLYAGDLHLPAEQITGKTDYEFFPTELADKYRGDDKRVMDAGQVETIEEEYLSPGAERRYISTTKAPIRDERGEVIGLLGIFMDITEQKRAEEAVRESEYRFRQLFDRMGNGVAVYEARDDGADFVFRDMNQAGLRSGRVVKEEIIGQSVFKVFPGVRELGLFEVFQRVWRTGVPEHHPSALYEDKRIAIWVENEVYKLPSGEIVAVYEDVTERKQAEEAFQRSEGKARDILDSISDAFFSMDDDLMVTHFNTAAERVLNRRAGEVLGRYIFDAFPEARGSVFDEKYHQAAREKRALSFEVNFQVEPYRNWYDVRVYPQEDGISVYFQVVTERKLAEAELQRLNLELEDRVRDRTAQLEAANRELEAFSYSVSHDLRAPLRHLTGFVNLLTEHSPEALDQKSRHYLEVISQSAVRMGRLIDDILSFSRMGRGELMHADVDMARLVEEVRAEMQQDLEGREVVWSIGPLPGVRGDRAMLKTVFANLLGNAVKFTRDRTQAVIEVGHRAEAGEEIFFVRDNGAGFDMQYSDKLFGLFQRLHREDEFEGTGVGLANVRRIVTRHGGRTWAEGKEGEGAVFFFSLPKGHQL